VVEEAGITALLVDPVALAKARGIDVVAKPAAGEGVSGMLIRIPGNPDEFVIAYATHIDNEGFQRFSIAHELGHFVLDGHCDHLVGGDTPVHHSRAGLFGGDRYEMEAEHFAAGLLMPRRLFVAAMGRAGKGFQAIQKLHEQCRTSLTSTAIR
jgi:Zn-dependent peptidase ImmA (M78 family)